MPPAVPGRRRSTGFGPGAGFGRSAAGGTGPWARPGRLDLASLHVVLREVEVDLTRRCVPGRPGPSPRCTAASGTAFCRTPAGRRRSPERCTRSKSIGSFSQHDPVLALHVLAEAQAEAAGRGTAEHVLRRRQRDLHLVQDSRRCPGRTNSMYGVFSTGAFLARFCSSGVSRTLRPSDPLVLAARRPPPCPARCFHLIWLPLSVRHIPPPRLVLTRLLDADVSPRARSSPPSGPVGESRRSA